MVDHAPRPSHHHRLSYALAGAGLAAAATTGFASLHPVGSGDVALGLVLAVAFAATGVALGVEKDGLLRKAEVDALTGLWNRRHLELRLRAEIARASRLGAPLAMLVIDVDHLKEINDWGGHQTGDAALVVVAGVLDRQCRAADLAARYGGDEFVVLAPGTGAGHALNLAERIRGGIRQACQDWPAGASRLLTVSIGVVDVSSPRTADPGAVFAAADRALYMAKACGRDCVFLANNPTWPGVVAAGGAS